MFDFISGAWKAARTIYPDTVTRGCAFHFSQAVWRKVQELGLATTYTQRGAEYRYVRSLLALPFLPPTDIDQLNQRANSPELQQLNRYIRSTWLDNATWCPRTWSVHQQRVRTNNDVEGWHTRLKSQPDVLPSRPPSTTRSRPCGAHPAPGVREQIIRDQRTLYTRLQNRHQQIWE